MTNPPESELEVYCEWICTMPVIDRVAPHNILFTYGGSYWFHEDAPPMQAHFKMVVNELDEPITKLCRKS